MRHHIQQHVTADRPFSTNQRRHGFTLVELLVALLLIEVALLALSAMGAIAVRALADTSARSAAVSAVAARLERLSASPCTAPATGSASSPHGIREWWTVQLRDSSTAIVRDSAEYPSRQGVRGFVLSAHRPC